ncbi:putative helicase senataxin [Brachionus plicatilis]|uniref:Putative helicase senataxin n=1 Tax=Brachionus plicatilis TaxID=10195 RepID=A0A3M7RTY0_BRAPC|nr:putative helicase senataxin [Brachionus plicatilis]
MHIKVKFKDKLKNRKYNKRYEFKIKIQCMKEYFKTYYIELILSQLVFDKIVKNANFLLNCVASRTKKYLLFSHWHREIKRHLEVDDQFKISFQFKEFNIINKKWVYLFNTKKKPFNTISKPSAQNDFFSTQKLKTIIKLSLTLKEAEKELEELKKKIKKFEDQLAKNKSNDISYGDRKKLEAQAKEKVLKEADIIISTLNFSGNSLMDCLTAEKNNGNSLVSVVIIDEAAQCLEVESLIPLRFGCDRIIQVGDPEQLPATVLSRIGQERGLAMSLFERVYQRFRYMDKSPIRMLYVQYRMHPDICHFPSHNFYKNKLKTHKDTAQKRSVLDLKPYLFFNVINSQEIGDEVNGSVFNPVEGEHILEFCKYLSGKYYKFSIGIITPYQKQVGLLRDLLIKNSLINKIEVGTVDSFQGREKDIVIFSCVRARNASRSIGFLAHRQRLNVALTRGRFALYIFGHAESLVVNSDWNNCVHDAKQRSLIFNLEYPIID